MYCVLCGEKIEGESLIFEDSTMGCEYDIHKKCDTAELKKKFNASIEAHFYGE